MGTARFLATCNWTFLTFELVVLHENYMRGIVGLSKSTNMDKEWWKRALNLPAPYYLQNLQALARLRSH